MPTEITQDAAPIIEILKIPDSNTRETALKKRHEQERQQLITNPEALSEKNIDKLTDPRLAALLAEEKITEVKYIEEIAKRRKTINPHLNDNELQKEIQRDIALVKQAYFHQKAINEAQESAQNGILLTDEQTKLLDQEYQDNDASGESQKTIKEIALDTIEAVDKKPITDSKRPMYVDPTPPRHTESTIADGSPNRLDDMHKWLDAHNNRLWPNVNIKVVRLNREKAKATLDKYVPPFTPAYQEAIKYLESHPDANAFNVTVDPRGFASIGMFTPPPQEYTLSIEKGKLSREQAKKWILQNIPTDAQEEALQKVADPTSNEFSLGRDEQGRVRIRAFQTPNPWTNVKKEAQQSVTQSIRHEVGKGTNRLINPDYAHNEMINQYKLVRDALPPGTATRQMLEKTDKVVTTLLTASGLTAEAVNLLVNAVRGALLEAPELRYKVAALVPDDLVRQTYVAAVRTAGNAIREYIHKKYHLPDRPKKTPVMVNTLDQIKPEHYRAQDAQKVGITRRDLNREDAIKFIHEFVPIEKQESAIETIGRLSGNQFGVSIMDSGWVRIDSSAREPRTYDNRPRYGSYNATDATKMP